MFAELAQHYVETMNSDAIPTISSAWERVIDGQLNRVFEQALEELDILKSEYM